MESKYKRQSTEQAVHTGCMTFHSSVVERLGSPEHCLAKYGCPTIAEVRVFPALNDIVLIQLPSSYFTVFIIYETDAVVM